MSLKVLLILSLVAAASASPAPTIGSLPVHGAHGGVAAASASPASTIRSHSVPVAHGGEAAASASPAPTVPSHSVPVAHGGVAAPSASPAPTVPSHSVPSAHGGVSIDLGGIIGGVLKGLGGVTNVVSNIITQIISIKINAFVDVITLAVKVVFAIGGVIDNLISGLGSVLINLIAVIFKIGICVNGYPGDQNICTKTWNAQFGINDDASTAGGIIDLFGLKNCKSDIAAIANNYTNGKGISSTSGSINIILQQVTSIADIVASGSVSKQSVSTAWSSLFTIVSAIVNSNESGSGKAIIEQIVPTCNKYFVAQGYPSLTSVADITPTISAASDDTVDWTTIRNHGNSGTNNGNAGNNTGIGGSTENNTGTGGSAENNAGTNTGTSGSAGNGGSTGTNVGYGGSTGTNTGNGGSTGTNTGTNVGYGGSTGINTGNGGSTGTNTGTGGSTGTNTGNGGSTGTNTETGGSTGTNTGTGGSAGTNTGNGGSTGGSTGGSGTVVVGGSGGSQTTEEKRGEVAVVKVKELFQNMIDRNNVQQSSVTAVLNLDIPTSFDGVVNFAIKIVRALGSILDLFINGLGSFLVRIVAFILRYVVCVLGVATNSRNAICQPAFYKSLGVTVAGNTYSAISSAFKIGSAKADLDDILAAYTKKGLSSLSGSVRICFDQAYALVSTVSRSSGVVKADLSATLNVIVTILGGFANSCSANLGKQITDNLVPVISSCLTKNSYTALNSASISSTIVIGSNDSSPWARSATVTKTTTVQGGQN